MATMTLKNVPDELYDRLRRQAQAHRRSINSEAIHCLESVLAPRRVTAEERLARIRSLRPEIDIEAVSAEEIQAAIDSGRQ